MTEKVSDKSVEVVTVAESSLEEKNVQPTVNHRYFVFFSYDGTAYHGWQIQPNASSVQECLNKALTILLRTPTETVGAGRTDSGVHAACMVAHFDSVHKLDCAWLENKLNRLLPPDIAIKSVKSVKVDAHARFDAIARTYHYHIYSKKNPFRRHFATRIGYELDFALMNQAASILLNVSDFTSFSKLHTDVKTNNCKVSHAQWVQVEDDLWCFEITADRFLRNMVRAVVGTLLEVGRGRMTIEDFRKVIACKDRCAAGDSVPGNALSLVDIVYPDNLFCEE